MFILVYIETGCEIKLSKIRLSYIQQPQIPVHLAVFTQQRGRSPDAGLMLVHRPRRWPSITPALSHRVVFAVV